MILLHTIQYIAIMVKVVYENITIMLRISLTYFRSMDKPSRPDFAELLHALSSPVTDLLSWSEEDMRVHPQARVLGAPLEAGKDLYPELQGMYNC